jgi:hypothetical protein
MTSVAAVALALLAGCSQGRGLQPPHQSAATAEATPSENPTTSLPVQQSIAQDSITATTETATPTTEPPTPATVPVARPRATIPAPAAPITDTTVPARIQSGSTACGGSLPPCWVMRAESTSEAYPNGGDPTIWNRSGSGASGKWQFMPATWAGYGGYSAAAYAPVTVQDEKAEALWAGGRGCGHWNAC